MMFRLHWSDTVPQKRVVQRSLHWPEQMIGVENVGEFSAPNFERSFALHIAKMDFD